MEMQMEFVKKLPTPQEIKEQYPLTDEIKRIKEERDQEILDIFSGKKDKFLMIIGPCSADNEEAVVDYMHLIPWMGVFLIGAAIGKVCYTDKRSLFPKPSDTLCKIKAPIEFLGRHSLIVYLIHQPIGFVILYLFFHVIGMI